MIQPQIRATKITEAIIHIFQAHTEPLSLAELFRYVQILNPKTAYSTVFRLISKLEKEGQVIRIDWRERGSRYERQTYLTTTILSAKPVEKYSTWTVRFSNSRKRILKM